MGRVSVFLCPHSGQVISEVADLSGFLQHCDVSAFSIVEPVCAVFDLFPQEYKTPIMKNRNNLKICLISKFTKLGVAAGLF